MEFLSAISDGQFLAIAGAAIAALFAGNFLCLDYRTSDVPSIAIWFHEESDEYSPSLVKIADSFSEFIEMLY